MAARALTAAAAAAAAAVAGRRVAGPPLLASRRSGEASRNHFSASAQREEDHKDVRGAATTTRKQVEAALNRKNVEVLQFQGEEHVATVLPDEAIETCGAGAGEDASWVPDQETGVFGPADSDTAAATIPAEGGSVLDQALFVREEEMEDVERPAMANANANANDNNF